MPAAAGAQAVPVPAAAGASAAPALKESDRAFLLEAAASSMLMIDASKAAEQRVENPLVKAQAGLIARDRAASLETLRQLARSRGLVLPETSSPERQRLVDGLEALPPQEMAQRYVQQIVLVGHEADVTLYEAMATSSTDRELLAWTRQTLAMLREHLAAARRLPVTIPT